MTFVMTSTICDVTDIVYVLTASIYVEWCDWNSQFINCFSLDGDGYGLHSDCTSLHNDCYSVCV